MIIIIIIIMIIIIRKVIIKKWIKRKDTHCPLSCNPF